MQPELGALLVQRDGGVVTVTFNRPGVRNAFTIDMWQELRDTVRRAANDPAVRVLVLRGSGSDFTAGSDIREFAQLGLMGSERSFWEMEATLSAVEEVPLPTIAAVSGMAMGAGLELALACDVRVCSRGAVFGMPIARLGITMGPRFARRLVELVGPARTRDMVYTGRSYGAEAAERLGLVNYVVNDDALDAAAADLARRVAAQSRGAVLAAKRAVRACLPPVNDGMTYVDPQDFMEGVQAFLGKRPPAFSRTDPPEGGQNP